MKLEILIPHYKETFDILKPMLDSLAIQQNIDFSELRVIIAEDANSEPITLEEQYPFEIKIVFAKKPGVSAARNAALDAAAADYVMFCDADDMFYNACGLWIIFREINNGGFDSLTSAFVEETRIPETKEVFYLNHDTDSTFVHGKVHRREYLIKNNIRWNEELKIHEDSFFNIQCQELSNNVKYCPTPFYLWKWRDDSVCRHDPKYVLKTYKDLIKSNDALIDEFIKRGLLSKAAVFTAFMIFDGYYTMNKPEWINQENKTYRDMTEQAFSRYYKKRKDQWNNLTAQDKMIISNQVRTRNVLEGMMMEATTIDNWLIHIESLT